MISYESLVAVYKSLVIVSLGISLALPAQADPTAKSEPTKAAAKPDPTSPVGTWKTIDDETHEPKSLVKIVEKHGKLYGTIIKLFRKPDEDQNPKCDKCEGALKDKPIIGMQILKGFSKDGDEWSGGKILDPHNGKTYSCILEVLDGGKKLKVRGYIGISLIGRTQIWERVK